MVAKLSGIRREMFTLCEMAGRGLRLTGALVGQTVSPRALRAVSSQFRVAPLVASSPAGTVGSFAPWSAQLAQKVGSRIRPGALRAGRLVRRFRRHMYLHRSMYNRKIPNISYSCDKEL